MQVNARDIDITWVVACRFNAPRRRVLILCSGWINRGPRTPPAQSKPYRDLGRLVNGTTRTTNERDMWMTVMPPKSEVQRAGPLRLVFHVRCDTLAEVRVWNYNKSLVMSSLGVRQAAVAVDGTVVWEGTLKRAPGNHLFIVGEVARDQKHLQLFYQKLDGELINWKVVTKNIEIMYLNI